MLHTMTKNSPESLELFFSNTKRQASFLLEWFSVSNFLCLSL